MNNAISRTALVATPLRFADTFFALQQLAGDREKGKKRVPAGTYVVAAFPAALGDSILSFDLLARSS